VLETGGVTVARRVGIVDGVNVRDGKRGGKVAVPMGGEGFGWMVAGGVMGVGLCGRVGVSIGD